MAAASSLPAKVTGPVPGVSYDVPRRPPMREGTRLAPEPVRARAVPSLASECTARMIQWLDRVTAQSEAVLESVRPRLTDGESAALSNTSHLLRKLSSVANSLRMLSEIEQATTEAIDCNALLHSICSDLSPEFEDTGARVTWGELPMLRSNPAALTYVFRELIRNALNYRSADAPEIRIEARQTTAGWIFRVDDNGIGIHPRHAVTVFEPFFTADPRPSRPGLGLAVAQVAAQKLGGTLSVAPNHQHGCSFEFSVQEEAQG